MASWYFKATVSTANQTPGVLGRVMLLAIISLLMTDTSSAENDSALEYHVKAGYLYNFLKFVYWPDTNDPEAAYQVCLRGADPFRGALDEIEFRKAGNRAIELHRIESHDAALVCDLIFLGVDAADELKDDFISSAQKNNILLVGDIPDFVLRGGIIGFVVEDNRVRVEINTANARRAGLRLSSNLLEVASAIYDR